jgi:hypothetical protein
MLVPANTVERVETRSGRALAPRRARWRRAALVCMALFHLFFFTLSLPTAFV